MSSISTTDLIVETEELPSVKENPETDLDKMSSGSPKVAYQPATVNDSGKMEIDTRREQAYRRSSRKTVNIVAFIIVCLVVVAVLAVIIILLSPRREGGYEFRMIPRNITATLDVAVYPNIETIAEDIEKAFTALINGSIFQEVFIGTVVLNVESDSKTEVTILIILRDIGDHLGSPTAASEEPTDVLDLLRVAMINDEVKGFHFENWIFK